ncbi:lytic transglycosylase domain-containing protein [Actinomadura barringtoniae]|uniref:lytic transglycosylase domain-containing protein n=1 Tax=Actinomadura barringtoniae TaxID=1427535 RepID=UPI0027DB690B|nr:lytic transglycosylase domain-containing protein [Actinomadura barringtoniae]
MLLPVGAAAIAVLAAGSLSGGVYAVVSGHGKADPVAKTTAEPPPTGAPTGPVTNVADSGQVAPLRRVVPPDVLAVSGGGGSIGPAQIAKIRKLGKVRDVVAVAGGAVQLQGRAVNTFAVDPSSFRSWTPPGTAKKTDLWAALAADQFVVSPTAAEQLQLAKGFQYPIVAKSMPNVMMGGSGSLGLPGIDMLVSRKTGNDMGLVPNVAIMVNAPGVDPAKLSKAVGRVLGVGANVVNLHDRKYQSPSDNGGKPGSYLDLYKQAATGCPGLSWTVLAAIGQVESDHGRNAGRSSAGALGPMQFMPATWKTYGVDGDHDGKADIMNPYDAVPAAAKYLCANGAGKGGKQLYRAIWHYNHADWYVQKVLALAKAYSTRFS